MTADEFIAWAMEQPSGRYELAAGEVIAMAPERAAHNRAKAELYLGLRSAIAARGLSCEAFMDGMTIRVDDRTVYEPDVSLRCGPRLGDRAVEFADPLLVAEVLSPSTRAQDSGAKFADYFRLPSLRHYLILRTDTRAVIHHRRDEAGAIVSAILRDGALTLEPPGVTVEVAALFAGLDEG
jgi:Uma2 family endonuclease